MNDYKTTHLADYTAPDFTIEQLDLTFDLHEQATRVTARQTVTRKNNVPYVLDGENLTLVSIQLDNEELAPSRFEQSEHQLRIHEVPEQFTLEIVTEINPKANTTLNGLYVSNGIYCTQCEAQGFRRMTYFMDRPDVMTSYTTTVIADKTTHPDLLSNGNPIEQGDVDSNRHFVKWQDPFKKPSYLFALVAGDLDCLRDSFTTMSGREIDLRLYVEKGKMPQAEHAMESLKRAMRWDEERFGREYDLDIYIIVAVSDFNMGAMENKGLNVFNDKYILAEPTTATDVDYQHIETVVAHEYFHNWTGNRITCRDWFQLSLKEGLTVFREQEFARDFQGADVTRIEDVEVLRNAQFPEDNSPMAHPVRPDSYIEINNFYTATIYNKGAEVIRMINTIVGVDGFRKGMDLYFERHDGQAVTIEEFVAAMADANDIDLTQFKRWYHQAGTPEVKVESKYDAATKQLTLDVEQSCPATPGQKHKEPFYIPIKVGLINQAGDEHILENPVLTLSETKQQFTFDDIPENIHVSYLRDFSAPVKLDVSQSTDELGFLMAHDTDGFSRWEASQRLAIQSLFDLMNDSKANISPLLDAYATLLTDDTVPMELRAKMLSLPSEKYLGEQMDVIRVDDIHRARKTLSQSISTALHESLQSIYLSCKDSGDYKTDLNSIAQRRLKNITLHYLMQAPNETIRELCYEQFSHANNMTDVLAALTCFSHDASDYRQRSLDEFYQTWKDNDLVIDKWLGLQSRSQLPDALEQLKSLVNHSAFSLKNPNKVYALLGGFCFANPINFHQVDGAGYAFVAENVSQLNKLNPQIAARIVKAFSQWRKYDDNRAKLMRAQLENLCSQSLSRDVHEVVEKSLQDN